MSNLRLPNAVIIKIVTWAGPITSPRDVPYRGAPIGFDVRTFARFKNDYHLGPFFSEGDQVRITHQQLELSAQVHIDFGLMDYKRIDDCFALVEIAHWSSDDVKQAIEFRKTEVQRGSFFSDHDRARWGTPREYCDRLRESASARMSPMPRVGGLVIRDEWDGSASEYSYTYRVSPDAAA